MDNTIFSTMFAKYSPNQPIPDQTAYDATVNSLGLHDARPEYRDAVVAVALAGNDQIVRSYLQNITSPISSKLKETVTSENYFRDAKGNDISTVIASLVNNKPLEDRLAPKPKYHPSVAYLEAENDPTKTIGDSITDFALSTNLVATSIASPNGWTHQAVSYVNQKLDERAGQQSKARIADPNFDGLQFAKDNGLEMYSDAFADTVNGLEAHELRTYLQEQHLIAKEAVARPITNIVGGTVGMVFDAPNLVLGGGIGIAARSESVAARIFAESAVNTGIVAIQEAGLSAQNPYHLKEQAAANTMAAGLLATSLSSITGIRTRRVAVDRDNLEKGFFDGDFSNTGSSKENIAATLKANAEGLPSPQAVAAGKMAGLDGTDTQIAAKFQESQRDALNALLGSDDITNMSLSDFDRMLKNPAQFSEQMQFGSSVNKTLNIFSPLENLKHSEFNTSRIVGNLSGLNVGITKGMEAGEAAAVSARAMLKTHRAQVSLGVEGFDKLADQFVKSGKMTLEDLNLSIRDAIVYGKHSDPAIDAYGKQQLKYLNDMQDVLAANRLTVKNDERFIKTNQHYAMSDLDSVKASDPVRYRQVIENLSAVVAEAKRSFTSLKASERRKLLSDALDSDDPETAFFSVPFMNRVSSRITEDNHWKLARKMLKDAPQESRDALKKAIKDKDIKALKKADPKIAEAVKARIVQSAMSKAAAFARMTPEQLFEMRMKNASLVTAPGKGRAGVLKRVQFIFPDETFRPIMKDNYAGTLDAYNSKLGLPLVMQAKFGEPTVTKALTKVRKSLEAELKQKIDDIKAKQPDHIKAAVEIDRVTDRAKKSLAQIDYVFKSLAGTVDGALPSGLESAFRVTMATIKGSLGMSHFSMTPEILVTQRKEWASAAIRKLNINADLIHSLTDAERHILGVNGEKAIAEIISNKAVGDLSQLADDSFARKANNFADRVLTATKVNALQGWVRAVAADTIVMNSMHLATKLKNKEALSKKETIMMKDLGVGEKDLENLLETVNKYKGVTDSGIPTYNIDKWSWQERHQLDFIHRNMVKVTSEANMEQMPRIMTTGMGRVIFALKSFSLAFSGQGAAHTVQRFKTDPASAFQDLGLLVAGGAFAIIARDAAKGNDPMKRFDNPDSFALQVAGYSGIMGLWGDIFSGAYGTFVDGRQDAMIGQMSPVYGKIKALQDAVNVAKDGDINEKQYNRIMGALGVGNILGASALTNYVGKTLGE